MFDYAKAVNNLFKQFLKKQESYVSIVLKQDKDVGFTYDAFTNFYNLKFLPSFTNNAYDFLPPDFDDKFVTSISNIIALYDLQDDLPRIRKCLVQMEDMSQQLPSLRSLLHLAKWMRDD